MLTWNLSGDGILTLRTDPSIPANADFIHNGVLERTGPWSSVGNVVITTGNATDTVNVNDSVANVPVTVNLGSGSDTVNVTPTSQFLDHIQGNLTLNGGIGFDTLNVFDPIDGGNDTYTMTSSSVMRNRSVPINYGSFTDVFIYGGFGNETYNVNGTSSAPDTGLITGSGSDTVNVRGTTRPLDVLGHGNVVVNIGNNNSVVAIHGDVRLGNEQAVAVVNVNDQADAVAHTAIIDSLGFEGRLQGIGAAPITWAYAPNRAVNINLGAGTSVVDVLDTGVPTNLFNNGFATVNIGNSGSIAGIAGQLNLENEPSFDTVNINDQIDAASHAPTIDTLARSGDTSLGRLQGLGAAPITWDYGDTLAVNINFGDHTSDVNVLGTGVTTNLFNNGNALIAIGGGVASIQGAVNLENEGHQDFVEIVDFSDTTPHTATIDTVTRSGDSSLGRLQGIGFAPITWDYLDTSSPGVELYFGRGTSTVDVLGTGVPTILFNSGPATVNVGAGSVAGIAGPLSLENQGGLDTVNVNDQSDTTAHFAIISTVTGMLVSRGQLQGISNGDITWDYQATSVVNLNFGAGTNNIRVLGTGATTNLFNNGDAFIDIGLGNVAGILRPVNLENEGHQDRVEIEDDLDTAANTATIDTVTRLGDSSLGRLQGTSFAPITWDYLDTLTEGVVILFGSGTSTVNVQDTGVPTNLITNGAATINVGSAGSVAGIAGPLLLQNEQVLGNTVNINDQSDTATHLATIDTFRDGPTALGRLQNISNGNITWTYSATSAVNIDIGTATNVFVLGTGVPTTLLAPGDVINVGNLGSTGSVAGIVGALNLQRVAGVTVNDQSDAMFRTATIDTLTGSGSITQGRLQGLGAAPITWDANIPAFVSISSGSGGATLTVQDTAPAPYNLMLNGSASGVNTLVIGGNVSTVWDVGQANAGTFHNAFASGSFTGFQNVAGGGPSANTFTFESAGSLSGTVTGGGGSNLLNLLIGSLTVNVTAADAGNIPGVVGAFGGIGNVTISNGINAFVLSDGASLSGILNGGGGTTTLNEAAYTTPVTVNLATNTATGTGGIAGNVKNFIGGSGTNTLAGPNTSTTWNITAQNAGNLFGAITFSAFQNLTGGSDADVFRFASGAGIDGNLDGGGGSNILNESAYTTPVTVNLGASTVTGVGGAVANIQVFTGGSGSNTLVGPSAATTWILFGSDAGSVSAGFGFSAFQNLIGGAGDNAFVFENGATLDGTLAGGGTNTLDYSAYTSSVIVDLQTGQAPGVAGGVANIANVHGGNSSGPGLYNLLIGNGGNVLTGGTGRRNILVAGASASTLVGGNLDDLLVAGTTAYDTDPTLAAWLQIAAYWAGTDDYGTRVANLTGASGVPLLDATVVTGNGGGNTLTGNGELGLLYTDGLDGISGFDPSSQVIPIGP